MVDVGYVHLLSAYNGNILPSLGLQRHTYVKLKGSNLREMNKVNELI